MQFVDEAIKRTGKRVKQAQKVGHAIEHAMGGKIGANLGKFLVSDVIEPIATAGTAKAVEKIQGAGLCHHCGAHSGRLPTRTIEHHYDMMEGHGFTQQLSKMGRKMMPVLQVMKPTYLDQLGGLPQAIGKMGGSGMKERYMRQVEGEGYAKGSAQAKEAMEKARSHVKGGKARMVKGSPEAKAFMANLRAMRGKK